MTTKKHRRRGVVLSLTGQRKLEAQRRQLEKTCNEGERFTLDELSGRTQLAISTITRVLEARVGVDKITLDHFFAAFDLCLERSDYQQPDGDESAVQADLAPTASIPDRSRADWGEGVDVTNFYGRSTELATLTDWIAVDGCRLVAMLGMGGIGKTALSVKLAQTLAPNFEFIIWRSLRNAPPLATLLADLVPFLSAQQDTQNTLVRLIYHLQNHRCLVILDNLETLFQGDSCAGQFRSDYQEYSELLRLIAESNHQSCVILTSREKPAEVAIYAGESLQVRSFVLGGSPEATQALLQAKGAVGTIECQQILGDRYGNSPLAIKIVATSIRDLFDGDIDLFLQEETFVFNGVRRLLDRQFDRLSALEQSIMYWLAINREWTTVAELYEDIVPTISRRNLLEALESLTWRNLIESKSGRYTQQSVVMEYITEISIERVITEFQTLKLDWSLHFAFIKTTVKDYIRSSQTRLILGAIGIELQRIFSSTNSLQQQILLVLAELRNSTPQFTDYGAGNLINLCNYLQIDLTGWDFSQLTIHHAALQQVSLHRVNFTNANFVRSSFIQPFGTVFSVAFSPDGTQVATGDTNGSVCLWRVADGQPLRVLKEHTNWVRCVQFSPVLDKDARQLIASASHDRTVKIWDAASGECLHTLTGHAEVVWSISWSADGKTIASGGFDRDIRIWDIDTGECRQTLSGHASMLFAVAWHPDLRTLASGCSDTTIKIWDTQTGTCLHTLPEHESMVLAVAWSPDGKVLASSAQDQTIKLWNAKTGTWIATLSGHASWVWSIDWSPDGRTIASGSQDLSVKLWDVQTGKCIKTLPGHTSWIGSVNWSPDGQLIASGSEDCTVRLWDLTGQCLRTLHGYAAQVFTIAWNPQHNLIASGAQDCTVRLWSADTGKCTDTFTKHTSWVWTVAWSPDGKLLASGSSDNCINIWDIGGNHLHTLQGHYTWIWSVAWSPDGRLLASGRGDNTIEIWDVQTGECLNTLTGHTDVVWTVAWHPDGHILASGSSDRTIRLWDVATGVCLVDWTAHTSWIFSVAWSPDGGTLASGSSDTTACLWQIPVGVSTAFAVPKASLTPTATASPLENRQLLAKGNVPVCQVAIAHDEAIGVVAWHPDGQILATGASDCLIKLWDVQTGNCLKKLVGHQSWVRSIVWIRDGKILASGSADETIALWDLQTGTRLQTLRIDRPYEGMNILGVSGLTDGSISTLTSLGAMAR